MLKFLLRFSLLFNVQFLNSQTSDNLKIDAVLSNEIPYLDSQGKYKQSIALGEKMKNNSKSISYLKGEAWANYRISNSLTNVEDFKKSIEYLKAADRLNIELKDPYLVIAISVGFGRNYNEQKLSYSQANKEFISALRGLSKLSKTEENKLWKFYVYKNLISVYSNQGKRDSSYYYSQKANEIKQDAYVLTSLINYHLENSPLKDSALFYLQKSDAYFLKNHHKVFEKTIAENQWAQYFFEKNNFRQSLDHSLIANDLAKKVFSTNELLKSYEYIGESYRKMGDTVNAIKYLKIKKSLEDSVNKKLVDNLEYSVLEIVKRAEKQQIINSQERRKKGFVVFVITIICFGALLFYVITKKRRLKAEAKLELSARNDIILKKDKLLLNAQTESYKVLVNLAKANCPTFYSKFNEAYPDFQINLKTIAPKITHSELVFCAYIYLGFQTKDIAEYTFRSQKTIQNRKNSVRKTFKIDSKQDLYLFFNRVGKALD